MSRDDFLGAARRRLTVGRGGVHLRPIPKFALLAGLCALIIAGCGSDSKEPTTAAADRSEATPVPQPKRQPLDPQRERLQAAGFSSTRDVGSDASDGLSVEGGVKIAFYADPNQAAVVGDQMRQIGQRFPR